MYIGNPGFCMLLLLNTAWTVLLSKSEQTDSRRLYSLEHMPAQRERLSSSTPLPVHKMFSQSTNPPRCQSNACFSANSSTQFRTLRIFNILTWTHWPLPSLSTAQPLWLLFHCRVSHRRGPHTFPWKATVYWDLQHSKLWDANRRFQWSHDVPQSTVSVWWQTLVPSRQSTVHKHPMIW